VDIVTKPKFFGKVVEILADYDKDMDTLMAVNTGLSSRFSEVTIFRDMAPEHFLQLLNRNLRQKKIHVIALQYQHSGPYEEMLHLIESLSKLSFWGNARDVQNLAKAMVGSAFISLRAPRLP
jgi:hypothetical protein